MGLRGIIWNVDTLDWEYAATNPSLVLSNFQAYLAYMGSAGIIQLQHDIINQSIDLVPQVHAHGCSSRDLFQRCAKPVSNAAFVCHQIIDIIRADNPAHTFVSMERCVWGATYMNHPSYAYMNKDCPISKTAWSTPAAGTCPLSDWSTWSPCDVNCGPGLR